MRFLIWTEFALLVLAASKLVARFGRASANSASYPRRQRDAWLNAIQSLLLGTTGLLTAISANWGGTLAWSGVVLVTAGLGFAIMSIAAPYRMRREPL